MKPALSAALCVLCIFVPELASPDQKSPTTEIVSLNQTNNEDTLQYPTKVLSKNRFVFSAISNGVKITTIAGGDAVYRQIVPNGGRFLGKTGRPGLPGFTRMIAIPEGAQMQVTIREGTPRVLEGYLIYPVQPVPPLQPPPSEQQEQYPEPEFVIDSKFYQTNKTYPERLEAISYDYVRGCKIALLNVHTARYNPYQKKLFYYPHMEIDIRFVGGEKHFIPIEKRSIYMEEMYGRIFANYKVDQIEAPDLVASIPLRQRYDLLIITPSDFVEQANQLAEWKRTRGILTSVVTLDDIDSAGFFKTASGIRDYIKSAYNAFNVSYVLLLGDAEFIPPHYVTPHRNAHGGTMIGTDLYYGEMDYEGYMPDLGVGRIPVDTPVEAQTAINKILNYEGNPPEEDDFYQRILFASYFEDWNINSDPSSWIISDTIAETGFVQFSEEMRNFFAWEGYPLLPRQYTTDFWAWPSNQASDDPYYDPDFPGPMQYNDKSPIPEDLRWPGFAWDGSYEGIVNEINAGSFLAIQTDHGARHGWLHPPFISKDTEEPRENNFLLLHNENRTPVILSGGCRNGWFDNETDDESLDTTELSPSVESFAEKILRMEGGAVAVVASTRDDNEIDEDLTRGFIDTIWPGFLLGHLETRFPDSSARLSDALNYGKIFYRTLHGNPEDPLNDRDVAQNNSEMFNLFGDPTMEIWTENPRPHIFFVDRRIYEPIKPLGQKYSFPIDLDGVTVTLLQKEKIVGQGISKNGWVKMRLESPLLTSSAPFLTLTRKGYITRSIPLRFSKPMDPIN